MQRESNGKQEFELELQDLASRDWQLWSLGVLVLVVVALGFVSLGAPSLIGNFAIVRSRYLPQLFSGFIGLVLLFNIYIVDQKRRLNATRDRLLSRLLRDSRAEGGFLLDPLTQVFSAQYFEQAVRREVSRAERQHSPLCFLVVDVIGLAAVRARFGLAAKEHLLTASAELLRSSLRGSDVICRYESERFIVLLPDTGQKDASFPATRIGRAAAEWNNATTFQYKLRLSVRIAPFAPGLDWGCAIEGQQQQHGLGSAAAVAVCQA